MPVLAYAGAFGMGREGKGRLKRGTYFVYAGGFPLVWAQMAIGRSSIVDNYYYRAIVNER